MPIDPRRIEVMDDCVAEILRTKSADDCLRMLDGMWLFIRDLTSGGLREQHPDWSNAMIDDEVARRMADAAD
jgi:hypothetical protein